MRIVSYSGEAQQAQQRRRLVVTGDELESTGNVMDGMQLEEAGPDERGEGGQAELGQEGQMEIG